MSALSQNNKREALEKVVNQIQELPTLPSMIAEMNKLMMDPNTTAKQMGNLIGLDPAITSKILRVVNSPFYGFPSRIATITHAIVILGFNTVKSIALSVSFFGLGNDNKKEFFDIKGFWEHSIGVGACAKVLSKHQGLSTTEELFIGGLLHDIGKLIFYQYFPKEYEEAVNLVVQEKIPLRQAEEEIFEINHAEVGGFLLSNWKLSEALQHSVECHHNVAEAADFLQEVSIIHLSDILARSLFLGSGGDPYVPAISELAWDSLKIKESDFPTLLKDCWQEAENARIFLDFL